MWRITVIGNALLMCLFWLASIISMSMAYNRLMVYVQNDTLSAVPIITDVALSFRLWAGILPLIWIILSFFVWKSIKTKEPQFRSEYILTFTMTTVVTGFSMLIFFALAGILPFLLISNAVY